MSNLEFKAFVRKYKVDHRSTDGPKLLYEDHIEEHRSEKEEYRSCGKRGKYCALFVYEMECLYEIVLHKEALEAWKSQLKSK